MKKEWMAMMVAGAMLAGCSSTPRVLTDIDVKLPARETDSLMIYEEGATVPGQAVTVGTVRVMDGGMTPTYKCLYSQMLALAVNKTLESGGNGLRIDQHKLPSRMGSTCHQIWGTMLLVPDSLVTEDAHTSIGRLEAGKDQELLDMAKESINRLENMKKNPKNVVKVSAGPGWITSEFETPYRTYRTKGGFDFTVDYEHLWPTGLGLGVNYLHNSTSFDEGFDVKMWYLGPSLAMSMKLSEKWRMDVLLGCGLNSYTEKYGPYSETETDLGVMGQLGVEYMLTKRLGLGVQYDLFSVRMDKPEGYQTDKDEFYGIKRLNLLAGLRFYF